MKKRMKYEHMESGKPMELVFEVFEKDGHWTARLATDAEAHRAPTFYGTSQEQAERQLRKVFEKEYDLVAEELIG